MTAFLLTGASGVVGSGLLAAAGGHAVSVLQHRTPIAPAFEVHNVVVGDITVPRFGLDDRTYARLCRSTETIVHAAGLVTFGAPPRSYEAINVEGTRNVVSFAEDAQASLIFVSTAFVQDGLSPVAAPSMYESSKSRAEDLVGAARVPTTIVRPSIVVGDSRTGVISSEQGIHQMAGALIIGPVRILPGEVDGITDFVSQDYVANAILAAVDGEVGTELWVTSGGRALRNGQIIAIMNQFILDQGLAGDPIRIVPFDTIERLFLPVFLPELPRAERARVRRMLHMARYITVARELPSSAPLLEERFELTLPDPSELFFRNLQAWWSRSGAELAVWAS